MKRRPRTGRPPGRPPGKVPEEKLLERKEMSRIAREHAQAAVNNIVRKLRSKNEAISLKASEMLLDRGYGKAPQGVYQADDEGNVLPPPNITFEFTSKK